MTSSVFGWFQIIRLGLIQACLGAVVVVTTSTLNRIMVVEMAFPALLPGALVAWHYAVQMVRPRMGYGADKGRRSTPWMMGGMMVLGVTQRYKEKAYTTVFYGVVPTSSM